MNTLNFTFNFNAPVGQNIAHVDRLEAHFDKEMTMQVVDTATLCREATKGDPRLRLEDLARAVEATQSFFWAQSSWAVVYCVCREHLGIADNMSEFEKCVQGLTFTKKVYECPTGTIQKALANNEYMRYPLYRWPEGRASRLAAELMKTLEIVS
jgi:hypothetical protein